jgi:hypothetical protein
MTESVAEASTRLLRESNEPIWVRLGALLVERGVDVDRSAMATLFPDDTDMEFGVIVTPDRRVYEFDLHYGSGDLVEQAATATITDWRDRTGWWESTSSRPDIEDAVRIIGNG